MSECIEYETPNQFLFIDMSNMAVRNAFSVLHSHPDDNGVWRKWSEKMVFEILSYINKFKPNFATLAMDSSSYWRSKIYPQYKQNRAVFKKDCIFDYNKFQKFYQDFMLDFASTFTNIRVLNVENSEADDIIACCTSNFRCGNSISIVSNDKDFHQLLCSEDTKSVKIFDPLKREFITSLNPKLALEVKIITGDKNDGIPNIKRGVGNKKATAMIEECYDILSSGDKEMISNYKRNRALIDFSMIPDNINKAILHEFYNYNISTPSTSSMFNFVVRKSPSSSVILQNSIEILRNLD